jgi:UDP-3-O-[3-hydroxymyristoyl] glucosamine N-acyltransferase
MDDRPVSGVSDLETARPGDVGFAASADFAEALNATGAGVVLVSPDLAAAVPKSAVAIVSSTAHLVFTEISAAFYPDALQAWVTGGGTPPLLEDGVRLGANVSVGAGVEIGAGTVVGANTVIGPGVSIGRDCNIGANCTIEYSYLGNHVVILPGARLGVSGFGYLPREEAILSIPQLGRTIIQDRVEIGANSVVDRGALGDTVIGEGTKIGNLVVIAHNCRIGRNCMIVGFVGIAGSVVLEDNVTIAGGGGLAGHITLGAGTLVLAAAWVSKSFPPGSRIGGAPAQDVKTYWNELATLRRIAKGTKR